MPMGTRKRRDLSRARSALLKAILKSERLLDSTDEQVSLRAAAVLAQLAGALARLAETLDFEERLTALEEALALEPRKRRSA